VGYNVLTLATAEKQLAKAYDWYEERKKGLGVQFISSFERQVKRISINPEHYQIEKVNVRESNIEGFPYLIIFKFYPDEDKVVMDRYFISAESHLKRTLAKKMDSNQLIMRSNLFRPTSKRQKRMLKACLGVIEMKEETPLPLHVIAAIRKSQEDV
jgi:hypothetical protein